MTTPRIRPRVSCTAALALALTLGGCATAPTRLAMQPIGSVSGEVPTLPREANDAETMEVAATSAIRFDNEAGDYVRVYLVDDERQWLLGRVEAGARATLRIPATALAAHAGPMRLSVLAGTRAAGGASPGATATVGPMTTILSQRWAFSQTLAGGQLTWLPLERGATPRR